MIIEQPKPWIRWMYPRATWRMNRQEHAVYITFDDGPIPQSTPFILEVLREYGVKATFFMVGDNVRKYPELYEQMWKKLTSLFTLTSSVRLTDGCGGTNTFG